MKVKNNYTSVLGFGTARVLPGETTDTSNLPKGYDENHPLIKFYIAQDWLIVVGASAGSKDNTPPVDVKVNINTGGGAGTDNGAGAADDTGKPVERMNLEELKARAVELGLTVGEDDTRKLLIEKIKAAQKGNE